MGREKSAAPRDEKPHFVIKPNAETFFTRGIVLKFISFKASLILVLYAILCVQSTLTAIDDRSWPGLN